MDAEDRETLQRRLFEAEGDDEVLDAFLDLLPSADEDYQMGMQERPHKFVQKLYDIRSSAHVVVNAVSEYAAAKLMRMRWESRRLPKARLGYFDQQLLSIYDSANDALEQRKLKPEEEADRGRRLLNECQKRAEVVSLAKFTICPSVAKGELQCLANGEGFQQREISWKRQ